MAFFRRGKVDRGIVRISRLELTTYVRLRADALKVVTREPQATPGELLGRIGPRFGEHLGIHDNGITARFGEVRHLVEWAAFPGIDAPAVIERRLRFVPYEMLDGIYGLRFWRETGEREGEETLHNAIQIETRDFLVAVLEMVDEIQDGLEALQRLFGGSLPDLVRFEPVLQGSCSTRRWRGSKRMVYDGDMFHHRLIAGQSSTSSRRGGTARRAARSRPGDAYVVGVGLFDMDLETYLEWKELCLDTLTREARARASRSQRKMPEYQRRNHLEAILWIAQKGEKGLGGPQGKPDIHYMVLDELLDDHWHEVTPKEVPSWSDRTGTVKWSRFQDGWRLLETGLMLDPRRSEYMRIGARMEDLLGRFLVDHWRWVREGTSRREDHSPYILRRFRQVSSEGGVVHPRGLSDALILGMYPCIEDVETYLRWRDLCLAHLDQGSGKGAGGDAKASQMRRGRLEAAMWIALEADERFGGPQGSPDLNLAILRELVDAHWRDLTARRPSEHDGKPGVVDWWIFKDGLELLENARRLDPHRPELGQLEAKMRRRRRMAWMRRHGVDAALLPDDEGGPDLALSVPVALPPPRRLS